MLKSIIDDIGQIILSSVFLFGGSYLIVKFIETENNTLFEWIIQSFAILIIGVSFGYVGFNGLYVIYKEKRILFKNKITQYNKPASITPTQKMAVIKKMALALKKKKLKELGLETINNKPMKSLTKKERIYLAVSIMWLFINIIIYNITKPITEGVPDLLVRLNNEDKTGIYPFDGSLDATYDFTELLIYGISPFIAFGIYKLIVIKNPINYGQK